MAKTKFGKRAKIVGCGIVLLVVVASIIAFFKIQPQEFINISELTSNPEKFDNKAVRVKGEIGNNIAGGDGWFYINDGTGIIWIESKDNLSYSAGKNVTVEGIFHYLPENITHPSMISWYISSSKIELG